MVLQQHCGFTLVIASFSCSSVVVFQCKKCLGNYSLVERAGFYLPSLCKVLNNLILQLNSNDSKDLNSLVDLLFLHDFILSRDVF